MGVLRRNGGLTSPEVQPPRPIGLGGMNGTGTQKHWAWNDAAPEKRPTGCKQELGQKPHPPLAPHPPPTTGRESINPFPARCKPQCCICEPAALETRCQDPARDPKKATTLSPCHLANQESSAPLQEQCLGGETTYSEVLAKTIMRNPGLRAAGESADTKLQAGR